DVHLADGRAAGDRVGLPDRGHLLVLRVRPPADQEHDGRDNAADRVPDLAGDAPQRRRSPGRRPSAEHPVTSVPWNVVSRMTTAPSHDRYHLLKVTCPFLLSTRN